MPHNIISGRRRSGSRGPPQPVRKPPSRHTNYSGASCPSVNENHYNNNNNNRYTQGNDGDKVKLLSLSAGFSCVFLFHDIVQFFIFRFFRVPPKFLKIIFFHLFSFDLAAYLAVNSYTHICVRSFVFEKNKNKNKNSRHHFSHCIDTSVRAI